MARAASGEFGLDGIFDNVRDGLILVRLPAREIVLFNRAAAELCCVPMADALGKRLDRILPDEALLADIQRSSQRPMGEWPGHGQDVVPTRPASRHARELEVHLCRVDDAGVGGPLVLLVLRPSGIGLEAALAQVERLQGEARAHALLFSEAAHEFKTPLTVLALQAELLRATMSSAEPFQERSLQLISANIRRLMLLSQDLADLACADAGRLVDDAARVDLARLLRDEADNFRALAADSGLTVAVAAPRAAVLVLGVPSRLLQVIGNFLSNAVKFTPPGGRITVELDTGDGEACVSIRDTGLGMDPEDQQQLFRPFVRIESAGVAPKPGTGLGLHLSKRIVEAHGGRIGCFSAGRGQGMQFWFTVPLASPVASMPRAGTGASGQPSGATPAHWSQASARAPGAQQPRQPAGRIEGA